MKNDDCSIFSKNLKKFMKKTNIRFIEVSRTTGISYSAVFSYAKKNRQPTYPVLRKIIKGLRINPEWLFLDRGEMLFDEEERVRETRYVEKFFSRYGIDISQPEIRREVEEILTSIENEYIRSQLVRFIRSLKDGAKDKNNTIQEIDKLIEFLNTVKGMLNILDL